MDKVRISTSDTLSITNAMENNVNNISQYIKIFQEKAMTIQEWWKDNTNVNFQESLNQLQQRLQKVVSTTNKFITTVQEKAKSAEAMDAELSANASNL